MRPIELTPRLQALAHQVPQGACFADIGTDHARLPVWLIQQGVIDTAIAADIAQGPIARAKDTAEKYEMSHCISCRLGNGLEPVKPEEVDVIAIAGMGGETIATILEEAQWMDTWSGKLLLQPMTSVPDLRRWLWQNGFLITRDDLVTEERGPYVLISAQKGEMSPMSLAEEWVGRQSQGSLTNLHRQYLTGQIQRITYEISGLRKSSKPQDVQRLPQREALLCQLTRLEKEWNTW